MNEYNGHGRTYDAVYLHYLDRELILSTGREMSEKQIIQATRLLTFFTQSDLYVGLSAIWENDRLTPASYEEFRLLFEQYQLQTVSRDVTLAEFRASRAAAYRHDSDRYPNYYTSAGDGLEWLTPTWQKTTGSTMPLTRVLQQWTEAIPAAPEARFSPALWQLRDPVQEALRHREDEAVTFNYFSRFLKDVRSNDHIEYAIRRKISEGFSLDNQRHGNGDIATGIPELGFFDHLALDFPHHDIRILAEIALACGIEDMFRAERFGVEAWSAYVLARHSWPMQTTAEVVRDTLQALYQFDLGSHRAGVPDREFDAHPRQVRSRILRHIRDAARTAPRPA
ncbi:hypothetical protein, partial [Saccharothrix longispora]